MLLLCALLMLCPLSGSAEDLPRYGAALVLVCLSILIVGKGQQEKA